MKNISEYSQIIEKELAKYKQDSSRILEKFEHKFNKGSLVAMHHFNNASPELIGMVRTELEDAGYKPELIGNKPDGHITLRVSLLKSTNRVA
jgi:hypothetical protein